MNTQGVIYGLIDSETLELRYIGQTRISLEKRLRRHRSANYNLHLRRWLNTRPVNIITLEHGPADLDEAEVWWIANMRAAGARLVNITMGGKGNLGRKVSTETRAKISAAHLGKQYALGHKHSIESRARMSAAQLGHKTSIETRTKMSVALLGRNRSTETRIKISAALLGHKVSTETRAKMSAAQLGRKHSAESRTKISIAMIGNKHALGYKHIV